MPRRVRLLLVGAVVLVLLAVAAAAGLWWWRSAQRTELERAITLVPGDTQRYTWTDWADVRREIGTDVDESSAAGEVEEMLTQAYDADLSSASALLGSTQFLQEELGWSPASIDWELLAQSEEGGVVVVGLAEGTDVAALGDRLEDAGYDRPGEATGVWQGGEDVLATAAQGRTVTPLLQHVVLDEEGRTLTLSESRTYLSTVVAGRRGETEVPEGIAQVAEAAGEALSAAVYTGRHTCGALAMSQAGPEDQATADQLVEAAGKVNQMRAFAMAVQPDRDVLVAMAFETEEQARTNADSRAVLASGPAPGQGGEFPERFELGEVAADGTLLTMDLQPVDDAPVLSDLSTGPVLFATC